MGQNNCGNCSIQKHDASAFKSSITSCLVSRLHLFVCSCNKQAQACHNACTLHSMHYVHPPRDIASIRSDIFMAPPPKEYKTRTSIRSLKANLLCLKWTSTKIKWDKSRKHRVNIAGFSLEFAFQVVHGRGRWAWSHVQWLRRSST